MGIFDFFRGTGSGKTAVEKHAARLANKRAQAADRWESIQALASIGTAEAVDALLVRFTFQTDPSITDQEEKDAAFEAVVECGEVAIEPVKRFLRRAETVSWPLRLLERLVPPEEVTAELLVYAAELDLEYTRDPERKTSLLQALEERSDPRIVSGVTRFLEDIHETVRFLAVAVIDAQANAEEAREALLAALSREESVRVRARILDVCARRRWTVPSELEGKLTSGFARDASGAVVRR
jgi:HEAT repeat protein